MKIINQLRLVLAFPFLIVFIVTGVIFELISGERLIDVIKEV